MITLQEFFQKCKYLPGRLQNHQSKEGFINEFKEVLGSKEAKDAFSVLYIFVCEEKIPRVKGKSNIIYIGKTDLTLRRRWLRYAKAFTSDFNHPFFSYVVAHYGAIKIAYLHFDTKQKLKQAETDLLKDYYKQYKEFPPHNAQRK